MSTLVVLFVLVFGASLETLAKDKSKHGRGHDRGRHLGWERGRRVGQHRRGDDDRSRWRRMVRRDRRDDRRSNRRQRRNERRSSWGNDGSRQRSDSRRDRADYRSRQFTQNRGGHGRH